MKTLKFGYGADSVVYHIAGNGFISNLNMILADKDEFTQVIYPNKIYKDDKNWKTDVRSYFNGKITSKDHLKRIIKLIETTVLEARSKYERDKV
jgi:hypothetical protein